MPLREEPIAADEGLALSTGQTDHPQQRGEMGGEVIVLFEFVGGMRADLRELLEKAEPSEGDHPRAVAKALGAALQDGRVGFELEGGKILKFRLSPGKFVSNLAGDSDEGTATEELEERRVA